MKKQITAIILILALLILALPGCDVTDPGYVKISGQPISVSQNGTVTVFINSGNVSVKFLDETGTAYGIKHVDNRISVSSISYELDVAQGNISGTSSVNKFGRNIEIDSGVTADIWDGGHTDNVSLVWVAPTAAAIHNIVSSSASDAAGGVGARTLRLWGLPDWDTAEINEDISMNGTTVVPTVNSYVIIHRMHVLTKGATSSNVGIIKATATSPSATTITAQIQANSGQTEMAIYGLPSIQKAYMYVFYGELDKAGGAAATADVCLLVNPEPDAELTNFMIKHRFGLQTVGTSAYSHPFNPPKKIAGPAIIKVAVISGTNNVDISAGFDLVLVTD